MSGFKDKSEQNSRATEILLKQSLYASSIHCSYYAFVQNLLHVLFVRIKYNENQFKNDLQQHNTGTHRWASKLIEFELAKKSMKDYKYYQKVFAEVKFLREKSDYSANAMTPDDGYEAQTKARSLNQLLNQMFK